MKKSRAAQGKNKTVNVSTQSIQNFFASAPKVPQAQVQESRRDKSRDATDDTKMVYVEFLKKKLQGKLRFSLT